MGTRNPMPTFRPTVFEPTDIANCDLWVDPNLCSYTLSDSEVQTLTELAHSVILTKYDNPYKGPLLGTESGIKHLNFNVDPIDRGMAKYSDWPYCSGQYSIFVVMKKSIIGSYGCGLIFYVNSGSGQAGSRFASGGSSAWMEASFEGEVEVYAQYSDPDESNDWLLYDLHHNGSGQPNTPTLYKNGAILEWDSNDFSEISNYTESGTVYFAQNNAAASVFIRCLLRYSRNLSAGEISSVRSYLNGKYVIY